MGDRTSILMSKATQEALGRVATELGYTRSIAGIGVPSFVTFLAAIATGELVVLNKDEYERMTKLIAELSIELGKAKGAQ